MKKAEISSSLLRALSFLRFFLVSGSCAVESWLFCRNFVSEKTRSGTVYGSDTSSTQDRVEWETYNHDSGLMWMPCPC